SSRRRHTRFSRDWSSDVCSSDLIGLTIALTLLGWGVGGILGGIVADYLGRRKMLMLSIGLYSAFTGLSALAWDWESFVILRFLTGVMIGSEWGTGTSLGGGDVAGPRQGEGGRLDAVRPGARLLRGVGDLALRVRAGGGLLAVHVPAGRTARVVYPVASAQRARVRAVVQGGCPAGQVAGEVGRGVVGRRAQFHLVHPAADHGGQASAQVDDPRLDHVRGDDTGLVGHLH